MHQDIPTFRIKIREYNGDYKKHEDSQPRDIVLSCVEWDQGYALACKVEEISTTGGNIKREIFQSQEWFYDKDFPYFRSEMEAICSGEVRGKLAIAFMRKLLNGILLGEDKRYLETWAPEIVERANWVKEQDKKLWEGMMVDFKEIKENLQI